MNLPEHRMFGGMAIVTDWNWLRTHSYAELVKVLSVLNAKNNSAE